MGLVNCAELFVRVQTTALPGPLLAATQTASSLLNENQSIIMSLDLSN